MQPQPKSCRRLHADYAKAGGISACNSPAPFVLDKRGSSPFFAAWRSLVFEQLGEAGAQALYHWGFGSDQQYGEVGSATGGPPYGLQLSYWVDYYLSHWLPSPPGQDLLQTTATGCCLTSLANGWLGGGGLTMDTQTMAVRNVDGSVVILMSNYALVPAQPTAANANSTANYDNNGAGAPRTFALDLSALGNFTSATLVALDAATPLPGGPVPQSLTPAAQMQVTLPGYGMALLRLSNAQPTLTAAGVANAASYASGSVAPGEIVTLFGSALGPANLAGLQLTNPLLVANALAGVHVLFDGVPAPMIYASAGQVSAVVPYAVAGQSSTNLQVEYLGAVTAPVSLPVVAAVPGLFTANARGFGPGAILNNSDYSVNSAAKPVPRGAYVDIYMTGAGATIPASVDGLVVAGPTYTVLSSFPQVPANVPVTVTMGGVACPQRRLCGGRTGPDLGFNAGHCASAARCHARARRTLGGHHWRCEFAVRSHSGSAIGRPSQLLRRPLNGRSGRGGRHYSTVSFAHCQALTVPGSSLSLISTRTMYFPGSTFGTSNDPLTKKLAAFFASVSTGIAALSHTCAPSRKRRSRITSRSALGCGPLEAIWNANLALWPAE